MFIAIAALQMGRHMMISIKQSLHGTAAPLLVRENRNEDPKITDHCLYER